MTQAIETRFPIAALLAAAAVWSAPVAAPAPAQSDEVLVFVLAGQSNMVGQGRTDELDAELLEMPTNVSFFLNGEATRFEGEQSFGPEVTFAHELARALPGNRIVLVKFALGGSSLLAWAPDWDPEAAQRTQNRGQGPLYRALMDDVAAVRARLPAGARLAGVLWMQGERDARFAEVGTEYGTHFRVLIDRLRADLGVPDLPFLFGQVDPPPERYPAAAAVREAQRAAGETVPAAVMVSTEGVAKRDDDLHYDTAGQIELGRRFAAAYLALR